MPTLCEQTFKMSTRSKVKVNYSYDSDEHFAPPVRIIWITRSKHQRERWIFIHCCGQIGLIGLSDIISSSYAFKSAEYKMPVTKRHHAGNMLCWRTSHNQVVTRTPPLAKWSCCKEEIPRWDDTWNSRDGMIPFDLVDSGCLEGMYDSKRVSKSLLWHSILYPLLAKPLPKANTEEKTEKI